VLPPRQQAKLSRSAKDNEHAMSQTLKTATAVVGIDIGKNSFHVVGLDPPGAIVLHQKWCTVPDRHGSLRWCASSQPQAEGAPSIAPNLRTAIRFSNRPVGVKRFQTIHHHSVDVARGLVLLFGISATALPSWVSRTRWNNLKNGLAVRRYGRSKRIDELTSSIVP
jgi:hypothetical protein